MLSNIVFMLLRYGRHLKNCELLENGGMGSACTCGLIASLKSALECGEERNPA
jgi:hypothetical protein